MTPEQLKYLSYMLRMWRVNGGEAAQPGEDRPQYADDPAHQHGDGASGNQTAITWRASVESPLTGERESFVGLEDLIEFLRHKTGMVADVDDGDNAAG